MGTTTAHPLVGMLVGTGYIGHFDGDSSCSVYMHLSLNAEGSSENGFAFIKEMPLRWLQDKRELCAECGKGGQLLLCGTCSLVYHLDCLSPPLVTAPASPWSCPACIVSIAVHRLLPPHTASASTRCFCLHTLLLPPHTAAPTAPQADRPQPAGLCERAVVFVTAWVVGAWLLPPPTPSRERQWPFLLHCFEWCIVR